MNARGNILFLILLAVVLFAALSYAVTSSMRGGGKSASDEKNQAMAAQIVNYGTLLENTFNRMRVMGNYPEWGYDLSDDTGPSQSGLNATCTEKGCRLFSYLNKEGNMSAVKFDESFVDPRLRAAAPSWAGGSGSAFEFQMIQVDNIGTDEADLVFRFTYIPPDVCKAINKLLWSENASYWEGYGSWASYSGTMTSIPPSTARIGDESAFYKGKAMACLGREAASPPYGGDYYHVIWAR